MWCCNNQVWFATDAWYHLFLAGCGALVVLAIAVVGLVLYAASGEEE